MSKRIPVLITPEEASFAKEIADGRGKKKEGYASTRRWSKNGDYHYLGVMGELAYAKHYGVPLDTAFSADGDGGTDLVIMGKTVDVKTSTHPSPILKLNNIKEFKSEMLALARYVSDELVEICGFSDLRRFIERCYSRDFGHGPKACLSEQDLFF